MSLRKDIINELELNISMIENGINDFRNAYLKSQNYEFKGSEILGIVSITYSYDSKILLIKNILTILKDCNTLLTRCETLEYMIADLRYDLLSISSRKDNI